MALRPDLPALLVAHKLGGAREIERAARGRGDRPLWAALLDEGVLTPAQLFEALHEHAKFPVVPDKALASPPAVEILNRILTREDAQRRGILLLELSDNGKRAQFAMVDPTDEESLREVARLAQLQAAKVFVAEREALRAAIDRAYRPPKERASVEPAGKVGQRSELEAAERLERVLVQASLALGAALEEELSRSAGTPPTNHAREAARLAREVGRELGLDRRRVALVGLTAMLAELERLRSARRGDEGRSLFDQVASEVGWAGGGGDGLLGVARAITAQSAGFGQKAPNGVLQRVVQAVGDFSALGADGEPVGAEGIDAAEQLLRASSSGAEVVDALMKVLRRDLAERTPAVATPMPEMAQQNEVTTVRAAPLRPPAEADRTMLVPLPQRHPNDPSREG